MLQNMFVQWVRDLQLADKRECRDVLSAVGNFGQLALKVANIRFEATTLPHIDGEKMVVPLLSLLARCVLGEEYFGHLLVLAQRPFTLVLKMINSCSYSY